VEGCPNHKQHKKRKKSFDMWRNLRLREKNEKKTPRFNMSHRHT
jgi:hypothetical protein